MSRIVRLTESDLIKLVKRVIKEAEENDTMSIAKDILSKMSDRQISQLKNELQELGVKGFASKLKQAYDCVSRNEMMESEEDPELKRKLELPRSCRDFGVVLAIVTSPIMWGLPWEVGPQTPDWFELALNIAGIVLPTVGFGMTLGGNQWEKNVMNKYKKEKK